MAPRDIVESLDVYGEIYHDLIDKWEQQEESNRYVSAFTAVPKSRKRTLLVEARGRDLPAPKAKVLEVS
ncbi:hypothetical protein LTR08_002057 [Meristemomyces frigidus]|nr:hypothetical protein LTR08_002057 [Meristemomyces frigidus]